MSEADMVDGEVFESGDSMSRSTIELLMKSNMWEQSKQDMESDLVAYTHPVSLNGVEEVVRIERSVSVERWKKIFEKPITMGAMIMSELDARTVALNLFNQLGFGSAMVLATEDQMVEQKIYLTITDDDYYKDFCDLADKAKENNSIAGYHEYTLETITSRIKQSIVKLFEKEINKIKEDEGIE